MPIRDRCATEGSVWSILTAMAKLQRWRRGRTAGEGSPVTDVPGDHAEDPVDDDAPAPEEGDPARADTRARCLFIGTLPNPVTANTPE